MPLILDSGVSGDSKTTGVNMMTKMLLVLVATAVPPSSELVAERRCKTFEEAIDQCLDAIKKQIDKYKEKHR